jgi:iron(III) transport system ATP-binding protein
MFLSVANLCINYPGAQAPAVDNVTLALRAGDIGVLIGPSGCGKTTLLRAVAGLERLTSGSIAIEREPVSKPGLHVPAEQRRIGMVFQDYALFPHLDIARNVGFGIHHLPQAERTSRVTEVLALVGLQGMESTLPARAVGRTATARGAGPRTGPPPPITAAWTNRFPTLTWTCANVWRTRCAAS